MIINNYFAIEIWHLEALLLKMACQQTLPEKGAVYNMPHADRVSYSTCTLTSHQLHILL